jgi:hypothetical protein
MRKCLRLKRLSLRGPRVRNRTIKNRLAQDFLSRPKVISKSRYIGRAQGRLGELAAQFTARGAVHPMQAMPNFATAIVTARLARAILARGLDPCFWFLHDGRKPGRMSLVWDAVEPLRPRIVHAAFGYAGTHEFEKRDFLVFVHRKKDRPVAHAASRGEYQPEGGVNEFPAFWCTSGSRT